MAASLLALLLTYPGPVVHCTATSPVYPGQPVGYSGSVYEPAPGHAILFRMWIGKRPIFMSPGTYPVTLLAEDDRGLWGAASCPVIVLASPAHGAGAGSPSPVQPSASVVVAPGRTLRRGDSFQIQVTVHGAHGQPTLTLPQAFYASVSLPWGTADYRGLNEDPPQSSSPGSYQFTCGVPWGSQGPGNGVWHAYVSVPWAQGDLRVPFDVTVSGDAVATVPWVELTQKNAAD